MFMLLSRLLFVYAYVDADVDVLACMVMLVD